MVAPFVFKIKTWQVLRTSCRVLLRVLLRSTHGSLKLTFSTGILSCRRDRLRSLLKFKSLTYVFLLMDFVYILYLTLFAKASLVIFAELCILLCYEVCIIILEKSFNLRLIFVCHFVCPLLNFVRAVNHF